MWLNESFDDAELGFKDYIIYRTDRKYSSVVKRGGGVLVAVKKSINSCLISKYDDDYESLIVKLCCNNNNNTKKDMLSVCSYLVKENGIDPYKKHCRVLDIIFTDINDDIIIIGDYNFNDVIWKSETSKFCINGYHRPEFRNIINTFNNLMQYNKDYYQYFSGINNRIYPLDFCFSVML